MIFITPEGFKKAADALQWIASFSVEEEEHKLLPTRDELLIGAGVVAVAWSAAWALKAAGERIGPVVGRELIEFVREEF